MQTQDRTTESGQICKLETDTQPSDCPTPLHPKMLYVSALLVYYPLTRVQNFANAKTNHFAGTTQKNITQPKCLDQSSRAGSWQLAAGSWQLAVGSWQLAAGSWQLAVGSWQLAAGSGRRTIAQNKPNIKNE